jgi:RNA polymerase sigma-70 factor (ECF subfamily)
VHARHQDIDKIVVGGARKLLSRASEDYSITSDLLEARLKSALEKYLLKDNPQCSASEILAFLDELQADDLCLILACESGNENAWSDLVARFTATVRSAARSASSNEDAAEDLAQSIWAELYGLRSRKDGKPATKLAYYSGRGSLAGWLRAVVAQLAIDVHRKQARFVQTEEDADLDRLARELSTSEGQTATIRTLNDPEQTISNKFAEVDISEALGRAVKELPGTDRLLVKLYYFDNLTLREAGVVLRVHEATASRRLSRIHTDLRNRVGAILTEDHGWTKSETERCFAEVARHIDADLESLLSNEGVR